jgi:hypothetical protein
MTSPEYVAAFREITEEIAELTARKNSDYSGGQDAFANFRLAESMGITTADRAILVRMGDKFQRIVNLIDRPAQVSDEAIEDTLKDLAVYSIILLILLREKSQGKE